MADNLPVSLFTPGPAESNAAIRWRERRPDPLPTRKVRISSLLPADSPRLAGENFEYIRALAQAEGLLPPIIVHRSTMRVVDGMHRLRAAELRGEVEIEAHLVEGDDEDAFLISVEANIAHGLPLSLADRVAAAARIVRSHPAWSDRAIASTTGLTAKTVAAVRRCASDDIPQLHARIGRDGRFRPLNSALGRRLAGELIAVNPDASLRDIARATGISPGTVRDVRARLRRGEDPVPPKMREHEHQTDGFAEQCPAPRRPVDQVEPLDEVDAMRALQNLRRDPSLRFTDRGRELLRLFDVHTVAANEWDVLADQVPSHCVEMVGELARRCARRWTDLADRLEQRVPAS